ncbi:hypothetical protein [Pseudofrankia sp. BMG5.37]|uniref:hypothetical protein n=1 Tax=Pseudofrankia sp. BMG5.37 TaxID=3050035 RepID=UPI002895FA83|nr:hypothetical protein [Pseudofrankia sp. BMG5.37]MDT3446842.1 hypothetical protein [Pseudofrankia sp. BMG5.37]
MSATDRRRVPLVRDVREVFRPRGYPTWRGYAAAGAAWVFAFVAVSTLSAVWPGWIWWVLVAALFLVVAVTGPLIFFRGR